VGIVTAFMLPGTSYFREMCSCRRAVPVCRSTTRICRLAAREGWQKGVRVRGVGGCSVEAAGSLSLSISLSLLRYRGTGRGKRGKVARNASATVRSPAPDEQIRNMGGGNIDLG